MTIFKNHPKYKKTLCQKINVIMHESIVKIRKDNKTQNPTFGKFLER